MKIKSYKKVKNNCYQLSFVENREDIVLFADVILKYNLLIKKEVSEKELQDILKENIRLSCYYKAISYLSFKNRSKKEIHDYLKKEGFKEQEILNAIIMLEDKKVIDEDKCLESFVHDHVYLGQSGPKRIMQKGLELGFLEEKLGECLKEVPEEVWKEKLEHLISKKIKGNHKDSQLKIKEKIVSSCLQEGYSKKDIVEILDGMEFSNERIFLQKEAKKLYQKLSRKYVGKELEYQMKGKLMQKGFGSSDIEVVLEELKEF